MSELPSYSGSNEQPDAPASGPAPQSVLQASKVMLVQAGFTLVGILGVLTTRDSLQSSLEKDHPNYDADKIDNLVNAAIGFSAVFAVVIGVVLVWLSRKVREGKSWARTVTIVWTVLGLVSTLARAGTLFEGISALFSVIGLVLSAAVLYFLTRPESSAYFAKPAN